MARALSQPVRLVSPEKGLDGRTTLAKARAPVITDARIGDFWLDTAAKKLYGPKNAGGWPDLGLIKGDEGWTPVFASVADGTRRVQQIVDWVGGAGTKPDAGQYVGADGLVDDIEDATDNRGAPGPQALISELDAGGDVVTYDTLVSTGADGEDNKQQALSEIFSAGGKMTVESIAAAQATRVPKRVKRLETQFYAPDYDVPATLVGGANYRRVNAEPAHAGKFQTLDRFLADGSGTDSANGGWWELATSIATPEMFGAIGDGEADDTMALQKGAFFASSVSGVLMLGAATYLADTATPSGLTARGIGPYNVKVEGQAGFKIIGAGAGKTRILTGPNGNLSVIFFVMNCHDFEISGIDFVGDPTGLTGLSGAIMVYSCYRHYVHDITTSGFLGSHIVGNFQFDGIYDRIYSDIPNNASQFDVASWQNMTVRNVTGIGAGGQGFQHIYDAPNANPDFNETGIVLEGNFSNGIRIDGCDWSAFSTGAAISEVKDVWVSRCKFHDNKRPTGDYRCGLVFGTNHADRPLLNINVLDCAFSGNGSDSGTPGLSGGLILNSNVAAIHVSVRNCKFYDNNDSGIVFLGLTVNFEGSGNTFGNFISSDQVNAWSGAPVFHNVKATGVDLPETAAFLVGGHDALGAWVAYTPVVTNSAGSPTAYTATGRYKRIGKTVICNFSIAIATNGAGGFPMRVTIPFACNAILGCAVYGKETAVTGKMFGGHVLINGTYATLTTYDGLYPGANGYVLMGSMAYQAA